MLWKQAQGLKLEDYKKDHQKLNLLTLQHTLKQIYPAKLTHEKLSHAA